METSRDDFVIAIRSAFLKKGNKHRFSLLSLIIFSIVFLILGNFNFKIINFNRIIIKEVIYFSSFITSVPENTIKNSLNNIASHFEYYDDYQEVKSELQELKNKDLSKKIITFENTELKRLIEDYFIEDSQLYAKVLIDKKSPFLRSVVVNKGSKNGIKPGMIVYDDIYLIGKIVEVNYLTARVLLISDINSKVPVTIHPLNVEAIMTGLSEQKGKIQYIQGEKLNNKNNEELIVVTSGSGGLFKSGIPIGKLNAKDTINNNELIVDFYRNFSQLKYVKILSYIKEDVILDQNIKSKYEKNNDQILKIKNQIEDINILQQQKIISDVIRSKLEKENIKLKKNFNNAQKKLENEIKINKKVNIKDNQIRFLELNLLYGNKCRKTFLKPNLYKITSTEYRTCVMNKGIIKETKW